MIFLYTKRKIEDTELSMFGCVAIIVTQDNKIDSFKFNIQTKGSNLLINEVFPFYENNSTQNVHLILDSGFNDERLPESVKEKIDFFNKCFEESFELESNKLTVPEFLYYTASDIINKLNENAAGEEVSLMQKQVAFAYVFLKISTYFAEHPDKVFNFPLYLEYLKQHNKIESEYSVEDFLAEVSMPLEALI